MANTTSKNTVDVCIIGGGPAGMSAALVAARALLETVVINAEAPRNAASKASHGFLTRDGAHASELLEVAKQQLEPYPCARYIKGGVTKVERVEGGIEVRVGSDVQLVARRLIVATGFRDELERLSLPGIAEVYGRSVFPCPFCDGFEHHGERLAVFGSEGIEHFVPVVRMWSQDIIVFANGAPISSEVKTALEAKGHRVITEKVAALHSDEGRLCEIELVSGERVARDSGFIASDYSRPATDFAEQLGVKTVTNDWGMNVLEANDVGKSNIEDIYVIGDAKSGFGGLMLAANQGAECASAIVHEIASTRWATL